MIFLDPRDPFIQNPPEWEGSISSTDRQYLVSLPVIMTKMQKERRDVILRQMKSRRWFLIRNIHGFKCTRCSMSTIPVIHEFITVVCKPCPFNGLSEALGSGGKNTRVQGHVHGERIAYEDRRRELRRLGQIEPITRQQAQVYRAEIEARTRQPLYR